MAATSLSVTIDSFVISAFLAVGVERLVHNAVSNAQLQTVAQQLGTEVFKRVEDIDVPPNSRVFVHGSNSGDWVGQTRIEPVGSGDFGTGFYTYQFSPLGVEKAAQIAISRAGFPDRAGGVAFVLFVAIDVTAFERLSKLSYGTPLSPTPRWSPDVNGFRNNRGLGNLGVDVAFGPVGKQTKLAGIRQWVVNPTFPNQYKFESVAQLTPIGIIPVASIFGPQLA